MFKSSDLVSFVLKMVGMPYWYGTCVYVCKDSLLKSKTNQYPAHYGSNRTATYKKHIAERKVCMDCIGMIKGFFWTNGGQGVLEYTQGGAAFSNKYGSNGCPDKGANGMLSWLKSKGCKNGKIATLPDVPGILLFKSGHVGVYIGGGYAVEAQGFAYGVVKTKVSKRPWTEWAYLPATMLDYDGASIDAPTISEPEPTTPTKLGDRVLRKGMKGDDVGELQTFLLQMGYQLPKYGADKDYGSETEAAVKAFQSAQGLTVDGVYGKASHTKLMAARQTPVDTPPSPVEPTSYTVGSTNETTIYNFLKEVIGVNTAAACGVLANIYRESGFRTDCYGDSETSYGICQWHKGRFTNLKTWCAENNKDYTKLDGQLWYLKQELEKSYKGVLSYIKSVTDDAEGAYNAGYYWCKKFEIPADTENNSVKRGELARGTYYPKYTQPQTADEGGTTYTVQRSDTLWSIAKKFFGAGNKYRLIMEANGMTSTVIRAGIVLKIPVNG